MLLIKKGQTNNLSVSVSLNATFSNPSYLFKFVNILSKDTYIFYPEVVLLNDRYDEFRFVEGSPTNLNATPPVVYFNYEGQYWVYIYQMPCGSTSLNPDDGEMIWDGRAQVVDDCPEEQYWQFISSNEDNANFIFLASDEYCPPTPSPTATATMTPTQTGTAAPTSTPTPSVTQTSTPTTTLTSTPTGTPTQTPSQTATQTPTETPTQTPTNTATQTPTNTPTQTQTQTPTNTATNTSTPTPTPTNTATQTPTQTNTPTTTSTGTPTPTPTGIPGFCIDQGFNSETTGTIMTTNNEMYVFGGMEFYDTNEINKVAKLNQTTAILNGGFVPGFATNTNAVRCMVQASNGDLYMGGSFTDYNGFTQNRIVKVDNTGAKVVAFNVGSGFGGIVETLALDEANNALYVGGQFTTFTGLTQNRITKLNATTGARDTTFNPGTAFNGTVQQVLYDGANGLYCAGAFTTFTGATVNRIVKLNATTGARDTTFATGTGFNSTVNGLVLSGGSLYAYGLFTTFTGATYNRFVKLNTNGSVDVSFPNVGFPSAINALNVDASGNIFVLGPVSYSGISTFSLTKILPTGFIDQNFLTNTNTAFQFGYTRPTTSDPSSAIAFDASNNIYITGLFSSFNGVQLNNYVKLNSLGQNITFNNCQTPVVTPTPSTTSVVTDSDALSYIAALENNYAAGLTTSVKSAINTMFVDLKNAGIYSKLYALYPVVGGSYEPMKFNAINPQNTDAAYRLQVQGGTPTWTSRGVGFNPATLAAVRTLFIPSAAGVSQDSFAMFQYTTISGTTGYDMGAAASNNWVAMAANYSGSFRGEISRNASTILSATGATTGFQAVSRIDASNQLWVRDGGAVNTSAIARNATIPSGFQMFIGAINGVGEYSNKTYGTIGLAQGLDSTELGNLRDIINTFETALNR